MRMRSAWRRFFALASVACGVAGCRTPGSPRKTDPEIARAANLAHLAFEKGAVRQATALYARALKAARAADDAREIGALAYNLAACFLEMAEADQASALLWEARAELQRANEPLDAIILMEAELARRKGEFTRANSLLDDLQRNSKRREPQSVEYTAMTHLIRANIACDQGDLARAKIELAAGKDHLGKASGDFLGRLYATESRIHEAEGNWAGSAALSDREADFWRGRGHFRRMAQALTRAGDAYKSAGNAVAAFDRYFRAARSWAAQGDDVAALRSIQSALDVQEKVGDELSTKRLAALFEEIKRRSAGASTVD